MAERKVTTKAELLRLIDQAADEGWTELDLSSKGLDELPNEIKKLKKLKEINLDFNSFARIPAPLSDIASLSIIHLNQNKISKLESDIHFFTLVEELYVNRNRIREPSKKYKEPTGKYCLKKISLKWNKIHQFPDFLCGLNSLKELSISYNSISHFSKKIASLNHLETLDFSGNPIIEIPNSFPFIRSLRRLSLGVCEIQESPDSISQMEYLEELFLGTNKIGVIPESLCGLKRLRAFAMNNNEIQEIPLCITKLQNLQTLNLYDNNIASIPNELFFLTSLRKLNLYSNSISEVPEEIFKLKDLETLSLSNNNISAIPDSLVKLKALKKLALSNNPIPISPEILEPSNPFSNDSSVEEILNYWQQLKSGKVRPLNEAKLLLVGQGSVGKTSLINRLLNDTFDSNESQTDGLAVHDWQIHVNSKDIRLNVWDFGGQEIYHATHQFFLTKRSLYLLVCNCRTSEDENRLEYWLKLIQSFGGSSPVIIVGNKNDEQPLDINRRALRDKYPNIKAILQTSCQSGDGIDELKEAIESQVAQLKEVYDLLPLKWFEVKEALNDMKQDFISYGKYIALCEKNEIEEEQNQEQLIDLLHNLGLVLSYRENPILGTSNPVLSGTNVLNPDWVTEGVYALFSDDELKTETKGILQPKDLSRILDAKRYPQNRHSYLIELLKEFQLGFELPNCPLEKRFLLPGLLPKEEPDDTELDGETLEFQYHYKVLPASVLSRFIVLMHEKIYEQTYWRSGVMLAYKEGDETFNIARIKADPEDKKVFISVSGRESTRRIFLSLIRDKFAEIHSAFADPDDVTEWVPVPEHPEADPLEYKELLGLEEMGERAVTIGKLKLRLGLRQLLDGYESREKRQQRQQGRGDNSVNITIQQGHGDNIGNDSVSGNKINEQNNY